MFQLINQEGYSPPKLKRQAANIPVLVNQEGEFIPRLHESGILVGPAV